jgi:hypothetical protein
MSSGYDRSGNKRKQSWTLRILIGDDHTHASHEQAKQKVTRARPRGYRDDEDETEGEKRS